MQGASTQSIAVEAQALPHPLPLALRAAVLLLLLCQAYVCVLGSGPSLDGKVDLRAFYTAGLALRSGHASQIYSYEYQERLQDAVIGRRTGALPFLYPPFAALPFIPLSLLPYRSSFFLLLLINLALLVSASLLLRPWLPAIGKRNWLLLPALYGCLFGVSVALMQGQISFALLVIYCAAWVLLQQKRDLLAGLVLALGLAKFQIALPVVLIFLCWRRWRFISGFLAGAAGVCLVSAALVGRAGITAYMQSIWSIANQTASHAVAAKARYGMFPTDMPNLHGLTYGLSHGAFWGQGLNVALSLAVLGFAVRQRASLLVALPAGMLVSYHMQPHDLTLLLLPLSIFVDDLLVRRDNPGADGEERAGKGSSVLLCTIPLLILPLAGVVMAKGINYVVAISVVGIMVGAARRHQHAEELSTEPTPMKVTGVPNMESMVLDL